MVGSMPSPVTIRARQEFFDVYAIPGLQECSRCLQETTVVVNNEEVMAPGRPYRETPQALRQLGIRLDVKLDDQLLDAGLAAQELSVDDVAIVVVATTPFLKMEQILYGPTPVPELPSDGKLLLAKRGSVCDGPLAAGHHGFDLDVKLVLREPRDKAHRRLWRFGSVVAAANFAFRPDVGAGLDVQSLTDQARRNLNLPAKTARYVEFKAEPWEEVSPDACITVWVDSKALELMTGGSSVRDEMQRELVSFVWGEVLMRALAHLPSRAETPFAAIEVSFLGDILSMISQANKGQSPANLLSLLFSDPSRITALSDSASGLRGALAQTLEKGVVSEGESGDDS
jgi:hypothetical protein